MEYYDIIPHKPIPVGSLLTDLTVYAETRPTLNTVHYMACL